MRNRQLLAAIGALAIVVSACGGPSPTASPASQAPGTSPTPGAQTPAPTGGGLAADQVFYAWLGAQDPRSLEPQAASGSDEIAVLGALHRPLLYYDKDLNLVPALAEALPEANADATQFTYHLRADAKYADGTPIVAGDIVRAFRRLADPRNGFDYGYEACPIVGANEVLGADYGCEGTTPDVTDNALIDGLLDNLGVTAPDDRTVVVNLVRPVSFFPNITAMWLTAPVKEEWTTYAEAADLGSSGPYMVKEWTHNSEFVLVPNPNWYGEKPTIQEIHLTMGGDPEAAVAEFERGNLDVVVVPSTSARRVVDDPNLQPLVIDMAQMSISYYDFATCQLPADKCPPSTGTASGRSPSENKNFRIALTQAINKQELIDVTYAGLLIPANASVMPGMPGYDADYNPYPFDVAAANAHMATALQELGVTDKNGDGQVSVLDLGRLKFGYNCNAGHTPRVVYMAGAWRSNLGFDESQFDISCTDFGVFRTERRAGDIYDISRNGWGADFPHPDNQLRDLFLCGAGNNNSHYCNPAFDDLLNKGAAETDSATSIQTYIEAQRLLVDDAPVLWLGYGKTRYMVHPWVSGITATPSDHQNIGDVFYETLQILEH